MMPGVPCVAEVYLIGHQDAGRLLVLLEKLMPHGCIFERARLGDVVDEDCELRIFEVGGDETAVSLLPGSVPHLQPKAVAILGDILDVEIDADCCLREGGRTL